VIEVPVRVDEVLDRVGAYPRKGISDFGTCAGETGVEEKLAVWTCEHRDVSAGTDENANVVAQSLDRDSCVGCFPSRFLYQTGCAHGLHPGKKVARSDQPCGSGKTGRLKKTTARHAVV